MRRRRDQLLLILVGLAATAVYAPTVVWLWQRWTLSVWHNAHGLLVPFVVAYMIREKLRADPSPTPQPNAWGFAFVVPALLLEVLDTGMHTQLLSAVSLVLLLPGLSLLTLGAPQTRAIAFPLAFLVFALPIPLSMTEQLHMVLRHVDTAATAALVPWLGIPVYVEATTLNMAHASLEVGDACSGFSTLYAAAAMACLTAFYADGWRRRLLVVASAAPLAVAANILRIVLLVGIVSHTGIDVLDTWIHPASGMLTFALALPVIFWLGQPAEGRTPADTAPTAALAATDTTP
jgi:exosortase